MGTWSAKQKAPGGEREYPLRPALRLINPDGGYVLKALDQVIALARSNHNAK